MGSRRWTCKNPGNLAAELTERGHCVSARTVAGSLKELDCSLQGLRKSNEGLAQDEGRVDASSPMLSTSRRKTPAWELLRPGRWPLHACEAEATRELLFQRPCFLAWVHLHLPVAARQPSRALQAVSTPFSARTCRPTSAALAA